MAACAVGAGHAASPSGCGPCGLAAGAYLCMSTWPISSVQTLQSVMYVYPVVCVSARPQQVRHSNCVARWPAAELPQTPMDKFVHQATRVVLLLSWRPDHVTLRAQAHAAANFIFDH